MKFSSVFIIFLVTLNACTKSLTIPPPANQLVTEDAFKDTSIANSTVLGIYAKMMNQGASFANGGITLLTGLYADELYPTGTNQWDIEFFNNAISLENDKNTMVLWDNAYKLIYHTNACIEGLEKSERLKDVPRSNEVRIRLINECRVIRALLYFNLVNLFGEVPLITSTDYKESIKKERSAVDIIYSQITADLTQAKSAFDEDISYLGKTRASKLAASALLAKVYLYKKDYEKAIEESSTVLNYSGTLLEPELNNVFLAGSNEAIWHLRPYQSGFNTTEGQLFIPTTASSARPGYGLSQHLLNDFENGDKRRLNDKWVKSKVVGGQTFYYPNKYKLRMDNNTNPLEYYVILRVGEQYLIRAEARIALNQISQALEDINRIRGRAGLPAVEASLASEAAAYLNRERRSELFCEWGNRWFDLKRTEKIDEGIGMRKDGYRQITEGLFPIPLRELVLNSRLTQNKGY
ncbi:MAG: RagB/SusD family nutrient uptake outer membrane protein [Agriterribacter sp.]